MTDASSAVAGGKPAPILNLHGSRRLAPWCVHAHEGDADLSARPGPKLAEPCSEARRQDVALKLRPGVLAVLWLALGALPRFLHGATLAEALDTPGWVWQTSQPSGGGPWTAVSSPTHDGVDAARSGTPPFGGMAHLGTTLNGPGTVVFWARADTPGGSQLLAELEGGDTHYIQASPWRAYTLDVPAGAHRLWFHYLNLDYFGTAGDAAWVDQVSFTNYTGQRPAFAWLPPSATAGDGDPHVWQVSLVGELPFDIVWQHEGTNHFVFAQVERSFQALHFTAQPELAGAWRLLVSNRRGVTNSPPFTLVVTSTPPHRVELENSFQVYENPLRVSAGAAFTLRARAAGTAPLAYQWRKDGALLPGQNGPTLAFAHFSAADAGDYACRVTNALGAAWSQEMTLEFDDAPPVILEPPQPQSLAIGEPLELTVALAGALPLGIEWYKDGAWLPAETGPTLLRWWAGEGDTGVYRVRVFNPSGEVWSAPVTVSVGGGIPLGDALDAPTRPWSSGHGCAPGPGWRGETEVTHDGQDAAGSVPLSADGECVLAMQTEVVGPVRLDFWWKLEGGPADELVVELLDSEFGTVSSLSRAGSAGAQWVAVALQVPSGLHVVRWRLVSADAGDGVRPRAWVDEVAGQSLADALDTPDLAWSTWSADPVSGNPADGWFYQSSLSSDGEDAAQSPALNDFGRSFLETTVAGPAVLQVKAALRGDPDATLEVSVDGQPVPDGALYGQAGPPQFGTYSVLIPPGSHTVRWTLWAGEQWDSPARAWLDQVRLSPGSAELARALDNAELPWLGPGWREEANLLFTGGSAARSPAIPHGGATGLQTAVTGPADLEFDWLVDAAPGDYLQFDVDGVLHREITGYSGYPWQTVRTTLGPGVHFLRWSYVKDAAGSAGADAAWLDHVRLFPVRTPVILTEPADVATVEGDVAGLSVEATSAEPLFFQWYHNGQPLAEATGDLLLLDPVELSHAGQYFVVVSNSFGAVTSRTAQLTVTGLPPVFTQPLTSRWVYPGEAVRWEVAAAGPRPVIYRWEFSTNGFVTTNLLQNGPEASFLIPAVGYEHAGAWRVVAADPAAGVAAITTAKLVVGTRFFRLALLTRGLPEGLDALAHGLIEGAALEDTDVPAAARGALVVGAVMQDGQARAFVFGPRGAIGLAPLTSGGASVAWAINAQGDVVGSATDPAGHWRAVRWPALAVAPPFGAEGAPGLWASPEDLGLPPDPAGTDLEAVAINDRGQIAVNATLGTAAARGAWRWQDGQWQLLRNADWPPPDNPGWLQAAALSSLGHVAGWAEGLDAAHTGHAWLYDPTRLGPAGAPGALEARDLHLHLGFASTSAYSRATGVNPWGHVVGWRRPSRFSGAIRAWLLAGGTVRDLDLVSSSPLADLKLNAAGDIIAQGFSLAPGVPPRPCLLRPDGLAPANLGAGPAREPDYSRHRPFLLEELVVGGLEDGIVLETVAAINQAGVIAGTARLPAGGGVRRPYLLVPVARPGNQPPVAEDDLVTRYAERVMISIPRQLLRNDHDPDGGDTVQLIGCEAQSVYGGTVVLLGDWVLYTAGEDFAGEDRFDYLVADQRGGLASATVIIVPEQPRSQPALNHVLALQEPGTVPAWRFRGEPLELYRIEVSDTLAPGDWQLLEERWADAEGLITVLDPTAIFRPQRFYRAVRP